MANRTAVVLAAGIALGAVAGVVGTKLADGANDTAPDTQPKRTTVVAVQRRTLEVTESTTGQLASAQETDLATIGSGTVTAAPTVGTELTRGSVVARVDDQPVVLFYGATPMWRSFASGMTAGPDVTELETNLIALGHLSGVADDTFTSSTAAAIRRWETALGLDAPDGSVPAGQIVVASGAVQVTEATAAGTHLSTGSALAVVRPVGGAGLALSFTVSQAADRYQPGKPVTIVTSDGASHAATITAINRAATNGGGGFGGGGNASWTVSAAPRSPKGLSAGPVTVEIPTEIETNALAVPSRALVATIEGEQAVELADSHRFVAVQVGVFADGWVQVTGTGVAEGVGVVVPQ